MVHAALGGTRSDFRQTLERGVHTLLDMLNDYRLNPIGPVAADQLRAGGGKSFAADTKPGYPCRQCLRDADVGEILVLVAHDPFTIDSPYRSRSPIFLHERPCGAPDDTGTLPEQLTTRQLSVRAFDSDAMMIDAVIIDGNDLDGTLQEFFANSVTAVIHIHNATRGCWATSASRLN